MQLHLLLFLLGDMTRTWPDAQTAVWLSTRLLHIDSNVAVAALHAELVQLRLSMSCVFQHPVIIQQTLSGFAQPLSVTAQGWLPVRHLQADAAGWPASRGQRRSIIRAGVRAAAKAGRQARWAPRWQARLHICDAAPRGRRQCLSAGRSRQSALQLARRFRTVADHCCLIMPYANQIALIPDITISVMPRVGLDCNWGVTGPALIRCRQATVAACTLP